MLWNTLIQVTFKSIFLSERMALQEMWPSQVLFLICHQTCCISNSDDVLMFSCLLFRAEKHVESKHITVVLYCPPDWYNILIGYRSKFRIQYKWRIGKWLRNGRRHVSVGLTAFEVEQESCRTRKTRCLKLVSSRTCQTRDGIFL